MPLNGPRGAVSSAPPVCVYYYLWFRMRLMGECIGTFLIKAWACLDAKGFWCAGLLMRATLAAKRSKGEPTLAKVPIDPLCLVSSRQINRRDITTFFPKWTLQSRSSSRVTWRGRSVSKEACLPQNMKYPTGALARASDWRLKRFNGPKREKKRPLERPIECE